MKEDLSELYQVKFSEEASGTSLPKLLVLESKENSQIRRTTIFIGSDIDGTINEEHLPESQRIDSDAVNSAKDAFKEYESRGISVWLISSRTYEEVSMYKDRVVAHGGAIFEDGLGVEVPKGADVNNLPQVTEGNYHVVEYNGRSILVLAPLDSLGRIQAALHQVEAKTNTPLISSFIHDASGNVDIKKLEVLQQTAGHFSQSEALKSTVRFASAYIADPTEEQREVLKTTVSSQENLRLRDHGKIIEVYGSQNHKGIALQLVLKNPQFFFPDRHLNSVFPIVVGNKENDVEMMNEAIATGGIGVLAAGPLENQYWIDQSSVPEEVIKTTKVAGHGLKDVAPQVLGRIEQKFNIKLPIIN